MQDILPHCAERRVLGLVSRYTLQDIFMQRFGRDLWGRHPVRDVMNRAPLSVSLGASLEEALDAIVKYLDENGLKELKVGTRIIIVPGFRFRVVDAMVTNFHQPQSTLLLLISAFVAGDWHIIYDYALGNDFRFLSYGDSSLLFRR